MDIRYKITFHTYWHCGSGLAAGADVDALVIKDKHELPFLPGKTIKGLLREAVEELRGFQGKACDKDFLDIFGYFDEDKNEMIKSKTFFSNAVLGEKEKNAIITNNATRYLYHNIANTAIESNGIAKEYSLRKTEVVVPCDLEGEILNIPSSAKEEIIVALKYIKRLGQHRNRGLGRCSIQVIEEK